MAEGVEMDLAACEAACKKQACAIQFCLQRRNYQESRCADVIRGYYDCCRSVTRAAEAMREAPREPDRSPGRDA
jgi:hypothetical protein